MPDQTAAILAGVDAPRDVPARIRARLVHALAANTIEPSEENLHAILDGPRRIPAPMMQRLAATLVEDDADVAIVMAGIDGPRPVPEPMAARLEQSVVELRGRSWARTYQIFGAAAVAVLVVVASLVVTNHGRAPHSNDKGNQAIKTPSGTITPPVVHNSPPGPKTSVLPTKITNNPAPGAKTDGSVAPPLAVTGIGSDGTAPEDVEGLARPATRASAASSDGSSGGTDLLSSVAALIDRVLHTLGLDSLGRTGSIHGLPADDASMTAPNLAPAAPAVKAQSPAAPSTRKARSHRTTRTRKTPAIPAVPVAPSTPKVPATEFKLLTIGGGSGSAITVDVPAIGVSVSL